jgi:putative DNA primase/helicase
MMPAILDLLELVKPNGQDQWLARCPAHADREPSLSIKLKPDGHILLHCFASCQVDDILEALGLTLRDLYDGDLSNGHQHVYQAPSPTPDKAQQKKLENLWSIAKPLVSTSLACTYLASRGLKPTNYPSTLHYLPNLDYWHDGVLLGSYPSMLARVEHLVHGLAALHRTYLALDGKGKADVPSPKKLSKPIFDGATRGAAIRLFEPSERLAVTEGIETALAVHQATGWPVWACVSAIGLEHVVIPESVREVVICADHDVPGIKAAKTVASRLLNEGKTVRLAIPPTPGHDWLDALQSEAVLQ